MNQDFVTISELASILGISRQAVRKQLQKDIDSRKIEVTVKGKTELLKFDTLPEEIKERYKASQKEATSQAIKIAQSPNKDINFEKELWSAADKLRGSVDPSDYKYVVLGLIFLKYVSDAFYDQREKLQKEMADQSSTLYIPNSSAREKMLENKEMYLRDNVFYIPEIARWEYLREKSALADIAKYIDDAMEAIEKDNLEQLSGVLPRDYVRVQLEPHILGELVNIFSKIEIANGEAKEKDLLGRVYEYFIGSFASSEGKRGGEFFTPRSLVKLLVEVLEPFENSRVLDPCAGSGGMFIQSENFLKEHHKDPNKIAIYGQELNATTMKLCKMNLAIRGVFGNIQLGNAYYDDKFADLKVDFVLANPPFNAEWDPERLADKDPRLEYGIPPHSNANFMWIQHFLSHLTPNGMAGFVMANGALAIAGKEGEIRKKIIEADLVDIVITCPPKLFFNVTLPVSLWFLNKNKESGRFRGRKGETLFIDARETFTQISKKQVEFSPEQIEKIVNTARSWRGEEGAEKYEDIPGFCKATNFEEITKNGFVLTPGRYVGIPEEEDDGVPFKEKIEKLNKQLLEYFGKSKELEKEITENLKKLKV